MALVNSARGETATCASNEGLVITNGKYLAISGEVRGGAINLFVHTSRYEGCKVAGAGTAVHTRGFK